MFSTLSKTEIIIYVRFILSSANALNLDKVKFLSSGNGLKLCSWFPIFFCGAELHLSKENKKETFYQKDPMYSSLSISSDKILDWAKFKAFADDKINVNKNLRFVFGRIKNIVGEGENAGYQHFLLFP